MPGDKTQKYLAAIGAIGVLTSCFACTLLSQNQVRAANIFFIAAWLILVPLFIYLVSVRRQAKRVVRRRSVQKEKELEALSDLQGTLPSKGSGVGGRGSDTEPDRPL